MCTGTVGSNPKTIIAYSYLEGQHDLITFNPRYVFLRDASSSRVKSAFWASHQANGNTHYRGTGKNQFSCGEGAESLLSPSIGTSPDVLDQVWAKRASLAESCYSASNQTGGLVGTAFTARDMMQIVDALGEDGLLNYWGEG